MQSINLIPQEEIKEQQKTKAIKFSTIISIMILICSGAGAAFLTVEKIKVESETKAVMATIEEHRKNINNLAPVEIAARTLDKKFSSINTVISNRVYNSRLSKELRARQPAGVSVESFSLQGESNIVISGYADSYVATSKYITDLLDENFIGGDPALKKLVKSVVLTSASLEVAKNQVNFALNITIDKSLLKGGK